LEKLVESLNWRYAAKKFDLSKKITKEQWSFLEESLRLSASSYGLQPWKFIVIEDQKIKDDLKPLSYNQQQINTCSHLVVFTGLKTIDEAYITYFVEEMANQRKMPLEALNAYKSVMIGDLCSRTDDAVKAWSKNQCYIAMGQLLVAAAVARVDACPMEGIVAKEYDKYLKLEDTNYTTFAAVSLGFRASDDELNGMAKVRFSPDKVFKYLK